MFTKKAISPVVATALFLIVTVVAAIGFQTWFSTYSSQNYVNIEERDASSYSLSIEQVYTDKLYLKSGKENSFISWKILDGNNTIKCEYNEGTESSLQGDTRLLLTFDNQNATDLSGYGNNGTLTGGMNCSVSGKSGYGCEFDGVDDYINFGDFDDIDTPWTLTAWFNSNGMNGTNPQSLMGDSGTSASGAGFFMGIHAYEKSWGLIYNGNGQQLQISGGSNYEMQGTFNTWRQMVMTHDGTTVKMYLDGIEKNQIPINGFTPAPSSFSIGRERTAYWPFIGTIDEVAIYTKALTDSEIVALYKAGEAKFYEQILPEGVKEINITNCNLTENEKYEFVGFTTKSTLEETFIAR